MEFEKVLSILLIPFFSYIYMKTKEENEIKLFRDGFIDLTTRTKLVMIIIYGIYICFLILFSYKEGLTSLFPTFNFDSFISGVAFTSIAFYTISLFGSVEKKTRINSYRIRYNLMLLCLFLSLYFPFIVIRDLFNYNLVHDANIELNTIYFSIYVFILVLYAALNRFVVRSKLLKNDYVIKAEKKYSLFLDGIRILFMLTTVIMLLILIWNLFMQLYLNTLLELKDIYDIVLQIINIYLIIETLSWILIENSLYESEKVKICYKNGEEVTGYIISKKDNIVLLYNIKEFLTEVSLEGAIVTLFEP